eukprot:6179493-Pleurochrysis_carterae.AAC.1
MSTGWPRRRGRVSGQAAEGEDNGALRTLRNGLLQLIRPPLIICNLSCKEGKTRLVVQLCWWAQRWFGSTSRATGYVRDAGGISIWPRG